MLHGGSLVPSTCECVSVCVFVCHCVYFVFSPVRATEGQPLQVPWALGGTVSALRDTKTRVSQNLR